MNPPRSDTCTLLCSTEPVVRKLDEYPWWSVEVGPKVYSRDEPVVARERELWVVSW